MTNTGIDVFYFFFGKDRVLIKKVFIGHLDLDNGWPHVFVIDRLSFAGQGFAGLSQVDHLDQGVALDRFDPGLCRALLDLHEVEAVIHMVGG